MMSPEGIQDTLLNISAFAFIALLFWLYFKAEADDFRHPGAGQGQDERDEEDEQQGR